MAAEMQEIMTFLTGIVDFHCCRNKMQEKVHVHV